MAYETVGIIGAGVIGRALFDYVQSLDGLRVDYVAARSGRDKPGRDPALAALIIDDLDEALSRKVDLVLEAATPGVLAAAGPRILAGADLCGFSCSALADREVESAITTAATKSGTRFFLPHGAVLGLDGLMDGREQIDEVVITTTKSGPSLGEAASAKGVIFDGSTREACARFPRNVNVHAAVAIAGLGFDRTRSVVVADPDTKAMKHHIAVSGESLQWDITVSSRSLGSVTGAYTPKSAVGSLQRILQQSSLANV